MPSLTRAQLKALFDDQRDRLYRMLLRLSGNAQDAEDLLQETFLVVWRKRDRFEGRGAPEGFLRTTAMRLFLNTRQRAAARPTTGASLDEAAERPDPAQPSPGQRLANQDALRFLHARIDEADIHASVHRESSRHGLGQSAVRVPRDDLGFLESGHGQQRPVFVPRGVTES